MSVDKPLIDYSVGSNAFLYTLMSFTVFAIVRAASYRQKFHGTFRPWRTVKFHSLELVIDKGVTVKFISAKNDSKPCMVTKIGTTIPEYATYDLTESDDELVVDWKGHAKLTISRRKPESGQHVEYDFTWTSHHGANSMLEDHVQMDSWHWYGAGHVLRQPWPVERWNCDLGAFVVKETPPLTTAFGEVQERMWMTSSGVALVVDFDVPLFVSVNDDYNKTITLRASHTSPYQNRAARPTFLRYSILQTDGDVLSAFNALRDSKHVPLPMDIPDEKMFRHPIWSTWAEYKKDISQEKVLSFAKAIKGHGFSAAQIEIDDDWTPYYGDWEFDSKKFPRPKEMMDSLQDLGFRVMMWVHPFASLKSRAFSEGRKLDAWIKWSLGVFQCPAIVSWWNGYGALLDVTNQTAVEWFSQKMEHLKKTYGVHSFKVDAGEAARLSTWTVAKENLDNPNRYTKLFAEVTYGLDKESKSQDIRVGTGVQQLPMFFRLQDKDSNWGDLNGLRTIIPHVLTQGLLGYPFVLPDMIGGNAYIFGYPERELFIRWVQLNALMPSMQFSITPWRYDDEVVRMCRKMCELHENYSSLFVSLARESTQSGAPIIRPLWWIAPKDEVALTISSQFLVGNDVLVAPVLEKGARTRDVYLPPGTWRDANYNNQLEGGQWYRQQPAELDQLPHFIRI